MHSTVIYFIFCVYRILPKLKLNIVEKKNPTFVTQVSKTQTYALFSKLPTCIPTRYHNQYGQSPLHWENKSNYCGRLKSLAPTKCVFIFICYLSLAASSSRLSPLIASLCNVDIHFVFSSLVICRQFENIEKHKNKIKSYFLQELDGCYRKFPNNICRPISQGILSNTWN